MEDKNKNGVYHDVIRNFYANKYLNFDKEQWSQAYYTLKDLEEMPGRQGMADTYRYLQSIMEDTPRYAADLIAKDPYTIPYVDFTAYAMAFGAITRRPDKELRKRGYWNCRTIGEAFRSMHKGMLKNVLGGIEDVSTTASGSIVFTSGMANALYALMLEYKVFSREKVTVACFRELVAAHLGVSVPAQKGGVPETYLKRYKEQLGRWFQGPMAGPK